MGRSLVTWADFRSFVEARLPDLSTGSHPGEEVLTSSRLVDDLGLDSFDIVVLAYEIETNFGVQLSQSIEPTVGGLFGVLKECLG